MENVEHIDINLIDDPVLDMRTHMDPEKLNELEQSIRQFGVLQPLVVRKKGERYEVIAGHRRLVAAGRARLGKVPCLVRMANDSEAVILRVHENHAREDVDPVSEAILYARTIREVGMTIEQLAHQIGKSIQYVEDRLSIAEMPEYMREALQQEKIGLGVALELFAIEDEAWRSRYVSMAKNEGMTIATAKACRMQWEETRQRFSEAGLDIPADDVPFEPPKIEARCEKCGVIDDVARLRFVRIHLQDCA